MADRPKFKPVPTIPVDQGPATPQKPDGMSLGDWAKVLAGMGIRVGGAGLGAMAGGALTLGNPLGIAAGGAAGGAGAEALVEKYLEPKHEVNLGRVGVGGVMGAIPGSWMIRGGKTGLSAALGAGMGYGSTVANKVAEGTPVAAAVNPLSKEWSKMDIAGVAAGGAVGGLFGRFTKPHATAPSPAAGPVPPSTPPIPPTPIPASESGAKVWPAPPGWITKGKDHVFSPKEPIKTAIPSDFDTHNIRMEAERVANAKAKPMVKTVTSNIKKSLGQAQGDTRSSTTVPTSPIQAPENVELGTTPGSRFAVADPTLAEGADLGPGTALPVGPDYEGPSEATLAALGKSANKNMAKTHVTQARSAASQAGRQETAADLANTRATEGGVDLGKIDQNAAAGDIQVQMELEKAQAERMAQADAEQQASELERLRGDLTEEHDPYSISETVSGPGEHGGKARATFRRVAPPPPDEGDAAATLAGAAPVEPKGPVDPHGSYHPTLSKAKQAIIDSGNPEAYKLSRTKNNGLIKVERVPEVDPATELTNLDLNQPQGEQTVVSPPVEAQAPPVEVADPSVPSTEPPTDIPPPPPAPVPVAPKPKGPKGPKGASGLRVGGKGKAKIPVNEVGATPVDQIVAKDAEGNIMGPHGNPQNAAELIAARQAEEDAANAASNPVAEAQAPVSEPIVEPPVAEAPATAPEIGEELAAKLAVKKAAKAPKIPIPDIESKIDLINPSVDAAHVKKQVLDHLENLATEAAVADEARGTAHTDIKGKTTVPPAPKMLKVSIPGATEMRIPQTEANVRAVMERIRKSPADMFGGLAGTKFKKPNIKIDIPSPTWGTVEKYVPELGATHDELVKEALEAFGKRATGKLVSEAKAQYTPEELYQKLVEKGKRAPLTPEAPETVTLYRGQKTLTGKSVPEWITQRLKETGASDAQGRWFTDDPEIAKWYQEDAGEGGHIVKVEVPKDVAERAKVAGNPDLEKFSRDPEREFFVPKEIANQATPTQPEVPQGGAIPAREFYNLKKGTTQNLTPVDVAGEQYGLVKDLKKAGLATEDARREAGAEAQRLTKEAVASNPTSDELAAMTPEVKDKVLKDLAKGLKKNAGQRGFIGAMPMMRLAGGATGAAIGATQTPDDPWKGALLGGAAGALAPSAVKALIGAVTSNPNATQTQVEAVGQKVKDTLMEFGRMIPDYQRFSLLADVVNLPINVFVGPYGSAMMGALEHAVQGDPRGMKAIKLLLTPNEFGPGVMRAAFKEAGLKIQDASERTEGQMGKAGPEWFRRMTSAPGRGMTGGDIAARNILMEAGFTPDEARTITLTAEPKTAWGQGIAKLKKGAQTEGGKKSLAINLALPFYRTTVNQFERSLERTPIVGIFAQLAKDRPDPVAAQVAQQTFGAGLGGASFLLGATLPEGDPNDPTMKIVRKFMAESTGQYGTLVSMAFIAGQAYKKNGGDPMKTGGAVVSRLVNGDIPLPTPQPIQDVWRTVKGLHGDVPLKLPSGTIPLILDPNRPISFGSVVKEVLANKETQSPNGRPMSTSARPTTTSTGRPVFVPRPTVK